MLSVLDDDLHRPREPDELIRARIGDDRDRQLRRAARHEAAVL
jgi:hypothetical protein